MVSTCVRHWGLKPYQLEQSCQDPHSQPDYRLWSVNKFIHSRSKWDLFITPTPGTATAVPFGLTLPYSLMICSTLFDFKHFIWSHCQVSALSSSLNSISAGLRLFPHLLSSNYILLIPLFDSSKHQVCLSSFSSRTRLSCVILVFPSLLSCLSSPRSLPAHWGHIVPAGYPFSISLSPSLPRSFPCDKWGCLLGAVHIYWVGERTLSVSLTLHISIPVLNRHPQPKVRT